MKQPEGLLYSKDHEWVKLDAEIATVGITDYAQNSLGDIVYVELPRAGAKIDQFATAGVIESVKAVSEIFSPVGGEVIAVNGEIENDPAIVNREPYGAGWLFKLKIADLGEKNSLLSADAYTELTKDQ